jgi:hypothetical protein
MGSPAQVQILLLTRFLFLGGSRGPGTFFSGARLLETTQFFIFYYALGGSLGLFFLALNSKD